MDSRLGRGQPASLRVLAGGRADQGHSPALRGDRDEGFGGGSEETEVGGGGGGPKKNGPFGDGTLGLMGEVAIGTNWGSTGGFFTAVNKAARKRRGPAGFGMIITSGIGEGEPTYVVMIDCTVSFRCL